MVYLLYNQACAAQLKRIGRHIRNSNLDIPALFCDFYAQAELSSLRCIVPTGRAVRHLRKDCIRTIWKDFRKPTPALQLCTLDAFLREEFQQLHKKPQPRLMSDAFRFALFREALQRCVDEQRLIFYSRDGSAITLAVAQRLADIVYGLKRKGLEASDLEEDLKAHRDGNSDESLFHYARLHDVWQLFRAYEELLGEEVVDMPSLTKLLILDLQKVHRSERPFQVGTGSNPNDRNLASSSDNTAASFENPTVRCIVLDGFSEFTQPELEVLACYSHSSTAVLLTLNYEPQNSALFGNVIEARATLENAGFIGHQVESDSQESTLFDTERNYLQKHLFAQAPSTTRVSETSSDLRITSNVHSAVQTDSKLASTSQDLNLRSSGLARDQIHILNCENKQDELASIARFVKYCVQNQHIALHDIALVLRQPQNYAPLVREVFEAHGIPINLSDRASLATAPVIAAIFAMVDVVRGDYRRDDMIRALSSPFVSIDGRATRVDVDRLERVTNSLRIQGGPRSGGLEGWKHSLDLAIQGAVRQVEFLEKSGAEEVVRKNKLQDLEDYKLLRSDVDFFATNFPHRDLRCSPTEFHRLFLETFLEKLRIEDLLNRDALEVYHLQADESELIRRREQVEQNTRALGTLLSLLDELEFILRERKQASLRFRDYVEMLVASVRAAKVQIREKGNYGLTVTSIEQTRGIPYRVVILCGMVDLEFPLAYSPEYFLGKELPDSELRHIRAERMSFYHALVNPLRALCEGRGQILFSYPRQKSDGEDCLPSPFLKEVVKLYGLDPVHLNTTSIRKALRSGFRQDSSAASSELSDSSPEQSFVSRRNKDATEFESLSADPTGIAWCAPWIDAISSVNEAWQAVEQQSAILEFFRAQNLMENVEYVQQIVREYSAQHASDNSIREHLATKELDRLEQVLQRAISATDIERFAACPYQYFASKVLGLSSAERESTMLSPLEKGNLLHFIVYRFYTEIATKQRDRSSSTVFQSLDEPGFRAVMVDLDPTQRTQYKALLLEIAEEELAKLHFNHPFFQLSEDEILGLNRDKEGLLERWLDAELARVDRWQFKPLLFEQGFGMKARDRSSEPIHLGEVLLKGKVDRIELRSTEDGQYEFIVADYKSSVNGVSGNNQIKARQSFQLPLYMSAVEQLLRDQLGIDARPAGGVYYIFDPTEDPFKLVLIERDSHLVKTKDRDGFVSAISTSSVLKAEESRDEILQDLVKSTRSIQQNIADAQFPVRPVASSTCTYCSFSRLCRVQECTSSLPSNDELADI